MGAPHAAPRAQKQHLLDHRIGAREQRRRHGEAEFRGSLEIENHLEREFYRQIGW
jgi:hypothetical protein